MINLAIFCPECTPWLVLMLLGAWILGWLFWSMIKGSKYQATINELRPQIADLKKKNTDLHTELSTEKYNLEKRNGEYDKLRSKYMDLDLKIKVQGEELTKALNDYEQLKTDFDARKP
jgi:chromosome segregation ATPase